MKAPRLLAYAATAGVAALVDVGGFHALVSGGSAVVPAAAASFAVAALVNYRLSANRVFGCDWRDARRALRFACFALVGLAINTGVTAVVAAAGPVAPTLAKVAGVGVAFGANFAMNLRWVFRPGRRPGAGACADGRPAGGRTRRRAAAAAAWRPRPSARE